MTTCTRVAAVWVDELLSGYRALLGACTGGCTVYMMRREHMMRRELCVCWALWPLPPTHKVTSCTLSSCRVHSTLIPTRLGPSAYTLFKAVDRTSEISPRFRPHPKLESETHSPASGVTQRARDRHRREPPSTVMAFECRPCSTSIRTPWAAEEPIRPSPYKTKYS